MKVPIPAIAKYGANGSALSLSNPLIPDKAIQTIKLNNEAPNSVSAILTGPSQIPKTKPNCISP